MVGTKYSGNPNIGLISKEESTGPKTDMGKFRTSLNAVKRNKAIIKDRNGKSLVSRVCVV